MNDAQFDDTVAGFYRAAAGAIHWIDALRNFQRSIAAWSVHVHSSSLASGGVAYSWNGSDLPAEVELDYIRTYHRIDPRARLGMDLPPGEWVNCWEVFDDDFVANDRFYQDFLIPYGGRYVSGGKLIEDGSQCVILGVHRGIGSPRLDPGEIEACRRLARHLADALRDHRGRAASQGEHLLGNALLSRLRAPVALIDDERRVLHVNVPGKRLLAESGALSVRDGRLHCRRASDNAQLSSALRRSLWPESPKHGASPAHRCFLRAGGMAGGDAVGLAVHALQPFMTMQAFGNRPLAMVLFHEASRRLQLDPFVIGEAFGLTPGEARVAVAIARGCSPDQIAVQHGVSVHTVRCQLKEAFAKTGTARQGELVSLLAELSTAAFAGLPD